MEAPDRFHLNLKNGGLAFYLMHMTLAGHSHVQHPYFPGEEADPHMDLLCSEDDLLAMAGPHTDHVTSVETPPTNHVTTSETRPPTDPTREDVLTDKLDCLRRALLGEGEEEGAGGGGRDKSDEVWGGEHMMGGACPSHLPRGSYCLEGPEAINPNAVTVENNYLELPPGPHTTNSPDSILPPGAHTTNSPDSMLHVPESVHSESVHSESVHSESVHSDSLPSGPDSIPPVSSSPDCTQHNPDSIPHDSSSVPGISGVLEFTGNTADSAKEPLATGPESIDSPDAPSPQSTAEALGQYAMVGPEAKVGTSPTGTVPGLEQEGGVVFRNLPCLTCTFHGERETEMVELEQRYRDVLKEVFKQIHSSLGEWECV